MKRLAALYGGSSAHHRTLWEPKYRRHFAALVYLPDLARTDLTAFDGLLVPDRLNEGRLEAAEDQLADFLDRGGTLIALGERPRARLPGVRWQHRPTNFWWWLDPMTRSGLVLTQPEHPLFRHITLADATWHQHGVFQPPVGAETLLATEDGAAVLYIDQVTTPGRLVVTSLDPMSHFGSYFMSATERFLDGFLPWISDELL